MVQSIPLELPEVQLLTPNVHRDGRGFFVENYQVSTYQKLGIDPPFVQDNHSFSKKGVIRGMHFQSDPGQAKLVTVIAGEIFDVVVDIRPSSDRFGKWVGVNLSGKNHKQLYIPVGFAHGFAVLSPEAHVVYKVSSLFNPDTEITFCYSDPKVGIEWPFADPILSEKDRSAPPLNEVIRRESLNSWS